MDGYLKCFQSLVDKTACKSGSSGIHQIGTCGVILRDQRCGY